MFTRHHQRELDEIKALQRELDGRVTETLERIGDILAAHPKLVFAGIAEEIGALGVRFGLTAEATDRLRGLAGLVDWERSNFLPASDPDRGRRTRPKPQSLRLLASGVVADCLCGLEVEAVRAARRVADLGSGAGFPGLVLAIVLPQARVTLLERKAERCSFLRRAIAELGIQNAEVVQGPVERWSGGAGACDLVTSRKLGRFDTIAEWCAPLLAPGGTAAVWPGGSDFGREEQASAAAAAEAGGLRLDVHLINSHNQRGEPLIKHLYLFRG
jgi:16S rRNA (guanine(527)-N(7))-methyltransferase RsmG